MIPPLSLVGRQDSLDLGRRRDSRIRWLLDMHPVTAAMLVRIGWFPDRNKALQRLRRLAARGQLRFVGTVARKHGRPEHVYCRWRPKPDHLLHEIELTELCFRVDAGRISRGPHAVDRRLLPDAELWINGHHYHLELDRGTMSYAQLERRFEKYIGCRELVLWVCSSRERVEGMRRRAETIRSIALFTTLSEALASPHGAIWIDYQGKKAALPREAGKRPR